MKILVLTDLYADKTTQGMARYHYLQRECVGMTFRGSTRFGGAEKAVEFTSIRLHDGRFLVREAGRADSVLDDLHDALPWWWGCDGEDLATSREVLHISDLSDRTFDNAAALDFARMEETAALGVHTYKGGVQNV